MYVGFQGGDGDGVVNGVKVCELLTLKHLRCDAAIFTPIQYITAPRFLNELTLYLADLF